MRGLVGISSGKLGKTHEEPIYSARTEPSDWVRYIICWCLLVSWEKRFASLDMF